ncbi:hypothetical protein [Gluconobacter sp. GP1]|uniref:hypothetical protein n=1 Tax=Gluconobacter sp. GP1 TaxID=3046423 RepID=UPI00293F3EF0|nr:hypothetical protein [Gluconobacter sp. GP1]
MNSNILRFMLVMQTEYCLWWRNRLAILRVLTLLALAALLVPAPDAPYAILGLHDMGVILSADTGMVAGGLVLGVVALILLSLWTGIGLTRDAQIGVAPYLRAYQSHARSLLLGRYFSANAIALSVGGGALAMLGATLWWRNGHPPAATAVLLSMAIAIPPLVTSAFIGAIADLTGVQNLVAKVSMVFAMWTCVIAISLLTPFDVIGVRLVNAAMFGTQNWSELSFGILSTSGRPTTSWTTIRTIDPASLYLRIGVAAAIVVAGSGMLLPAEKKMGRLPATPQPRLGRFDEHVSAARDISEIGRKRRRAGVTIAGTYMLFRFIRRSRLSCMLFLIALICNCSVITGEVGRSLALTGVLLLFGDIDRRELRVASTLELTEAGLSMPSPTFMIASSISILLFLIDLPCWSYLGGIQTAAMVFGTVTVTFWLVITTRYYQMPLLGVGTTGILIYILALNNIPAGADILGFRHQSLSAAVTIGIVAIILVAWTLIVSCPRNSNCLSSRYVQ